jgi:hypothetical protein
MQKENPMHCVIAMLCLLITASALGVQVIRAGGTPAEDLAADSDGRIHHRPAELLVDSSRQLATLPGE